jgi:hypothetical protein
MGELKRLPTELQRTLDDLRDRIQSGQIQHALVVMAGMDEDGEVSMEYVSLTETYSPEAVWMLFKAAQEI